MIISTSKPNPKITTFNNATIKENLNYIAKFELPINIVKYMNSCIILNDN